MSKAKKPNFSVSARPDVTHLLTLEQMLCRERPYVRTIPPPRPDARFLLTSPVRKHSFYTVSQGVPWPPQQPKPGRPLLLRSILYEERLRDIMHRVSRTTYSFKAKYAALARPEHMYTCCPRRGF